MSSQGGWGLSGYNMECQTMDHSGCYIPYTLKTPDVDLKKLIPHFCIILYDVELVFVLNINEIFAVGC